MTDAPAPRLYMIAAFVVACAGIGFLSYKVLAPFLSAIAWAVVLAVVFHGPWTFFQRRWPKRRDLSAALLSLAIALVVLLPAGLFASMLASQAVDAAADAREALQNQNVSSISDLVALPAVAEVIEAVEGRLGLTNEDFQKIASGFAARASAVLAKVSRSLLLGAFDQILTFSASMFLLFFFLRDGDRMGRAAVELVPMDPAERAAILTSMRRMIVAIFRGSLLCALIQGFTGGIGWWIAGLPSPALAAAAMSIFSIVPLGGTAIVWLPGVAWAWYAGRPGSAIFLFIWGAVVTSFLADNVLRPILIGNTEELSLLVVFLGVFGGLAAFGLLGVFLGPVTLVLAATLIDVLRRQASRSVSSPQT